MPTRNINLTDQLDRYVKTAVSSGRYGNASEVIREGLRLLQERQREEHAKLQWLRGAVQAGLADIEQGRVIELDAGAELSHHLKKLEGRALRERIATKRA